MKQHEIRPPIHSKHSSKRVGRGNGSGHGTYSGKGCKGQKSRSGGVKKLGFEGGQLPLIQRLPRKRGFTNIFKTKYSLVNIGALQRFPDNSTIDVKTLYDAGLLKSANNAVKVLGNGELTRSLTIKAHEFSSTAEEKIVAAGGKVERI